MPEKDDFIRVRVKKALKDGLQKIVDESDKYDKLSELIRSILYDFVSNKLIYSSSKETTKDSSKGVNKILAEHYQKVADSFKSLEEKQSKIGETVMKLYQYIENGQTTFPNNLIESMEEEIIRLIEIRPMNSEELAKAFKMTESRILRYLNSLVKSKTLGLNKEMEYYLIE